MGQFGSRYKLFACSLAIVVKYPRLVMTILALKVR